MPILEPPQVSRYVGRMPIAYLEHFGAKVLKQLRRQPPPVVEVSRTALFREPGHFYSPIPSPDEVQRDKQRIFGPAASHDVAGIDLNEAGQLVRLGEIAQYYGELPFPKHKQPDLRYYFENPAYSYSDAIYLYGMLRHLKPKRVVEVGSGFSSAVILDTVERFSQHPVACTFIEPYPELLYSLFKPEDKQRYRVEAARVQDVDPAVFSELAADDILFIDSSHVAKTGSDVNYLWFEILPQLASGVRIHIHDIFYPFEYPASWVLEGRAWNEAYLLRAFLQYNNAFQIELFADYLFRFHQKRVTESMPWCENNPGGSIWLKKC